MKVQRQIDQLLAQRAAEWIETLRHGGAAERAAFAGWLRESKLHVEHYLELVAMDREIRALDAAHCPDVEALLAQAAPNVVTLNRKALAGQNKPADTRHRTRRMYTAMAAAMAAAAFTLAVLLWPAERITTVAGEQRTVTLPDGSVVTLNTRTVLRLDYSADARDIRLEAGEAVFKVAQEASRPFTVHTRTAAVRAVGTQFNVYQRPQDTVVSVLEGRVQVSVQRGTDNEGTPSTQELLSAGEQAQVAGDGRIDKQTPTDLSEVLSWRERRLKFNETPLAEMVREFNRYGGTPRLRLEGEAAERYRYGGVFDADDPESLAALLAREPDLVLERGEKEIVIRVR